MLRLGSKRRDQRPGALVDSGTRLAKLGDCLDPPPQRVSVARNAIMRNLTPGQLVSGMT